MYILYYFLGSNPKNLIITYSLIYFILSTAVTSRKESGILYSRSSFLTYFCAVIIVSFVLDFYFFDHSVSLFNGLIYCSVYNLIFICIMVIISFFILILTSFYPISIVKNNVISIKKISKNYETERSKLLDKLNSTKDNDLENIKLEYKSIQKEEIRDVLQINRDHYNIIEYTLLTNFILIGSITLLSSNDIITVFLAIELQSYGLYILSSIYRNSETSVGAGLTYFLLGGLSSCIILLGLSLLYINSGTTGLDGLYLIHSILTSDENINMYLSTIYSEKIDDKYVSIFMLSIYQYALQFSFLILSVGFLFKISAAPFHSWSPGVYDAIPTVTTTFVAIIPKISIFILFFDLVYSTSYNTLNFSWTDILLFSSLLSLIIGSILGLTQFRIKRLYAYSTVSHVGFILLALCVNSVESIQAFFFYILQYSLSNLNAFIILVGIGYSYANLHKKTKPYSSISEMLTSYKNNLQNLSPIEYIDQLKGYFYLNPILSISLSITLFSFIGIPPLVGFFAKQMILSSALDNGNIFMCLIAILTSVISAVYYLYVIKHMFFEKSAYAVNISITNNITTLSPWLTLLISVLSLTILLFIFLYHEIYFLMNIISILIVY